MTCVSGLHPLTRSRHLGSPPYLESWAEWKDRVLLLLWENEEDIKRKGAGEKEICQGNDGRGYQCPRGTDRLPSAKKLWSTELSPLLGLFQKVLLGIKMYRPCSFPSRKAFPLLQSLNGPIWKDESKNELLIASCLGVSKDFLST